MANRQTEACAMYGAFNLQDGHDLASFEVASDRFSEHLVQQGFVHAWQIWFRAFHDGYDARFPEVSVLVEMRFYDLRHRWPAGIISKRRPSR
ncbi:hypothetical protein AB1E33_05480 [Ruegeria sp. 2012CJ15-1]